MGEASRRAALCLNASHPAAITPTDQAGVFVSVSVSVSVSVVHMEHVATARKMLQLLVWQTGQDTAACPPPPDQHVCPLQVAELSSFSFFKFVENFTAR